MCPQLLSKPKFSGVEKIKTIGSTYMAATGLNVTPGPECAQARFYTHAFILTHMHTHRKIAWPHCVVHSEWTYMDSHIVVSVSSTFDREWHCWGESPTIGSYVSSYVILEDQAKNKSLSVHDHPLSQCQKVWQVLGSYLVNLSFFIYVYKTGWSLSIKVFVAAQIHLEALCGLLYKMCYTYCNIQASLIPDHTHLNTSL